MFDIFIKDALYDAAYKILVDTRLHEMAINRSDLERTLQPQVHHMLKHFVKIESMPDARDVNHWRGEIKGAFTKFMNTRYVHNNKKPTVDQWIAHTKHNALPEHGPEVVAQIHSDLTDDGEYESVPSIDYNKTHEKFVGMLTRCFTKINSGTPISHNDIY